MRKGYFNTTEVANMLGISTRTVARQVKQGKIIVSRHKGKLRYPVEQFETVEKEEQNTTKELIATLQRQLVEKDIQINKLQEDTKVKALEQQLEVKDKQIEKLQQAINNQQGLTKDITDKMTLLPPPKKKGFLSGLFQ